MRGVALKVGELAKRTGISVRTLHHYDEIGLLSPSGRSEVGYRLYAAGEIARLQQIVSLKQLGFPLSEIRACLSGQECRAGDVIALQIARLREQIAAQNRLCERLEALAESLRSTGAASVEDLLETIRETNQMEKYYTAEQLEELKQRAETLGEERIREVEAEWPRLIEQVRAEMERGTDPSSETVQRLAKRWMELVEAFTGGNPTIAKSLTDMYQQETTVHGMDTAPVRELMEYVGKALQASRRTE